MAGATAPTFANLIANIYARKTEFLGKFINKIDMVSQTEWSWWTSGDTQNWSTYLSRM